MLVRELGPDSYAEARLMQRKAKSADERKYWRDVAMAVARIARKRAGFDTATRMAIEADFSDRHESAGPELEPRKVDPIEELKRLIGDAETDSAHRAKVRNFSHHLRRPRGRRKRDE